MFDTYKDIFNRRGDAYHAAMTRYPDARRREFDLILAQADIREGHVVADMPAGGGYLRNYVAARQWTLVSIEASEVFFGSCPQDEFSIRHLCPLHATPLADASVDRIVSLAGLHHVQEKAAFYREAYRILKPGGRLCIADADQGSPVAGFLNGFVAAHSSMGHAGDYLDDQAGAAIRAAGFGLSRDRVARYTWDFATIEDMVRYCTWMFGVDRGGGGEVLEGISQHQGYEMDAAGSHMHWELRFLTCTKVAR